MGWLLIVSIAAMTSFMTMVQLIALTLTTTQSPAVQASVGSQRTESVSAKSQTKKNGKVRRSATHHTRRNGAHGAHVFNTSHQK
jgi:Cu/Zn superoxide dismutase